MWGKKMVEFDQGTNVATVYHIGNHLCDLQVQKDEQTQDIKVKVLLLYNTARPDSFSSALQPYPWQGTHPTLV